MSGMYENILPARERKSRSGKPLILALVAIAVMVLAVTMYPGVRIMFHQYQYKQFVSQLSECTTRAYYKENLRAEVDGQSLRIDPDNVYGVYNILSALGSGMVPGQRPDEVPEATLSYGDEATMRLWDVPLNDPNGRSNGVYVEFHSNKTDFSCILNRTDISYLMQYLSPENNSPWKDSET